VRPRRPGIRGGSRTRQPLRVRWPSVAEPTAKASRGSVAAGSRQSSSCALGLAFPARTPRLSDRAAAAQITEQRPQIAELRARLIERRQMNHSLCR
jgi:hypothetical protein